MRALLASLVVTIVAFTSGLPAYAIWIPPDVVDIPVERLVKNLEASLAVAPADAKVGILLQLARVHSAAYAQKVSTLPVVNPIRWSTRKPTIKGPHDDRDVRGAIGMLPGRGSNLLEALRQPHPSDVTFECDPAALVDLVELDGEVELRFRIPAGRPGDDMVSATEVKVARSTVKVPAVGRCLASKVAGLVSFVAKPKASTVALTFTFETEGGATQAFFGFGQMTVPERVQTIADDAALAAARANLAAARARYGELVALKPDHALGQLGLAWTLSEEGQRDQAIAAYRAAFKAAWATEQNATGLGLGQRSIAAEAATYLMPLLDKVKDVDELAELDMATRKMHSLPRPVTPIVVPLAPEVDTLARAIAGGGDVAFDLDGSGLARRWGWIGPRAAWLVWDPTDGGVITSGLQLFGSVSFWLFWRDGYEALAALDDDRDGWVRGAELAGLALWHDDGDGVSEPGEVRPVAAHGVVALATRADREVSADGTTGLEVTRGVVFADGTTRPTWDWMPMGLGIGGAGADWSR